jgi:hypothetical protein
LKRPASFGGRHPLKGVRPPKLSGHFQPAQLKNSRGLRAYGSSRV